MNAPKVGDWYLDRSQHDFICVIGVDDAEHVVDIRDEYGDVDEIEFEEWEMMDLVLCAAPPEWMRSETESDELDGSVAE